MTRVRALWIIKFDGEKQQIVFSRRFNSVERSARQLQMTSYVAIPRNSLVLHHITTSLRLTASNLIYTENVDACDLRNIAPVYSLHVEDDKQLTAVAIIQKGWVYCCVPFIEDHGTGDKSAVLNSSSLPLIVNLLTNICHIFNFDIGSLKVNKLDMYVSHCLPFGRLIDIDPTTFQSKIQDKPFSSIPTEKRPAWKPVLHKGRSQISVRAIECVQGTQCDRPDQLNMMDIHGYVTCVAELEGGMPEISLSLSNEDFGQRINMSNLLMHPCVSLVDPPNEFSTDELPTVCKIRFMPPLGKFMLCTYLVQDIKEAPVFGVLKLREDTIMDILLELKLNSYLKNSFEYFEVKIPFTGRNIKNADLNPSWGIANISYDTQFIVWNLGNKFPGKAGQVSLKATVVFVQEKEHTGSFNPEEHEKAKDYYAQVNFCTKSNAPSGVHIDSKSVLVSPAVKFKFNFEREFVTTNYKIWNSYDNSRHAS